MRDEAERSPRLSGDTGLAELRRYFAERYDQLKHALTRKLGSADHASDALHEAYVRLADRNALDA
ncbi:hypothetical protein V8Z80_17285 [Orrella sp. JC864]|uniref:hypothetical protein n=1 Tax=Orrella sp. JC864 TaxID=3120298 RepID=UPI00300BBB58